MDLRNLTVRIDPEMREWIERRAEAEDRSVAYVLRSMLVMARASIEEEERAEKERDGKS
jgi:uncharacterized protein (DUF1778 family)